VPVAGERLANPDLADTLRGIAAGGAEAFYRGAIAQRIAEDMAANGGLITVEDLAGYRAVEREPLRATFRGHAVYGAPPPVASGAALLEGLQILDHYSPPTPGRYDRQADVLHHAIEAWKAREPATRIADPAIWPVDLGEHLSRAHAAARFARIDPRRAGELPGLLPGDPAEGDDQGERVGRGTTAFVVADTAGNVVVVTQTLSTWGGSYYATEGLGFLYNNHLRGYRTAAGAYGHLRPLMRSSSMALPTMVFDERDGARRPRLAIASAGNAWIPASIYGVLSAVLDGGLPMQAAIEAPRFLVARDPADASGRRARVQIEDRFPRDLLDDLAARGHAFQKIGGKGELRYGFAAAVLFDPARGLVHAGTEPRRSHAAVAVPR
jgi:gamma-glutamyltranspeptidase/glutathione hydrolase